jgi:hypothetical protein
MIALLLITGRTPKTAQHWLIVETGFFVFWCFAGVMFFLRGLYRFIVKKE